VNVNLAQFDGAGDGAIDTVVVNGTSADDVVSVRTANGSATALSATDCQPTRWRAGETVFTWVSGKDAAKARTLLLQVSGGAQADGYTLRSAGPLRVLAGQTDNAPLNALRPSSGAAGADGAVAIQISATP
jgi:hypothetical protein